MGLELLVLVLVLVFLIGVPILVIIALVRVRRLERRGIAAVDKTLEDRVTNLERHVGNLNQRLREAVAAWSAARPAQPPQEPTPPPRAERAAQPEPGPPPPGPARAEPPKPFAGRGGIDLESIIAGRWLNRVGIVALLLAVAFFLKYAFDNDWVGPMGRVAIGLVAGALLLIHSQWLLGRGYRYFSEGMAGLGAGVLYLSLYAAWNLYQLVPQAVAFAGMIAVTAALVALALGRGSQRLAFVALIGGFLTPGLLSTGEDSQIVLFSYLLVLDAGLLAIARARNWRTLEPVALVWTIVYYVGWYERFYESDKLLRTVLFSSSFFLEFAALTVVRARRGLKLWPEQIGLILVNVAWFLVALHLMLYDDHRWALTIAVLVLAAAHLGVVRLLPEQREGAPVARLLFAGLALTFITLAIPIRLEGEWITMAWAVEGAVLIWTGFRNRVRVLRAAGLFLFVLVVILLVAHPIEADRLLLNARFGTFAVAITGFAVAAYLSFRDKTLPDDERYAFGGVAVMVNVFAVWALSLEVWDFFGKVRLGIDHELAQQLGLSVLWALFAGVLIVTGVRRVSPALRWQGLALIGMVVGKVFAYDLSFLERVYRILSFLVLGVVLLVVSFLYQRKLFGKRSGTQP